MKIPRLSSESYAPGFYKHDISYKGVRVWVSFNSNLTIRVSWISATTQPWPKASKHLLLAYENPGG